MSIKALDANEFVTIAKAARLVQVNGVSLSPKSVYRWALEGVSGTRLASWRIGGKRVTTLQALNEFVETLSHRDGARKLAYRSPGKLKRDVRRVERELREEGI